MTRFQYEEGTFSVTQDEEVSKGFTRPDRVEIISDGTVMGTHVRHADTKAEIPCTRVEIEIDAHGGLTRARLYCAACRVDYVGPAEFHCAQEILWKALRCRVGSALWLLGHNTTMRAASLWLAIRRLLARLTRNSSA